MDLTEVQSRISYDLEGLGSIGDPFILYGQAFDYVILSMYATPSGKATLDNLVSNDGSVTIKCVPNTAKVIVPDINDKYTVEIHIDIGYVNQGVFIDESGRAVSTGYERALVHELIHASLLIGDFSDDLIYDSGLSIDQRLSYALNPITTTGPTVDLTNTILEESGGLGENPHSNRISYLGQFSASNSEKEIGRDYSKGRDIEGVLIDDMGLFGPIDRSLYQSSGAYIFVLSDGQSEYTGNEDVDIVYSAGGDDEVTGSAGSDYLDGGIDEVGDTLDYSDIDGKITVSLDSAATDEDDAVFKAKSETGGWTDTYTDFEIFLSSDEDSVAPSHIEFGSAEALDGHNAEGIEFKAKDGSTLEFSSLARGIEFDFAAATAITVVEDGSGDPVGAAAANSVGEPTLATFEGFENIIGTGLDDTFLGHFSNDPYGEYHKPEYTIEGGDGHDTLSFAGAATPDFQYSLTTSVYFSYAIWSDSDYYVSAQAYEAEGDESYLGYGVSGIESVVGHSSTGSNRDVISFYGLEETLIFQGNYISYGAESISFEDFEIINFGNGDETFVARDFTGNNVDTIFTGDGNNSIDAEGSNVRSIYGGDGRDVVIGGDISSYIVGGDGDDRLVANGTDENNFGIGDDLFGGVGDDILIRAC